MECKTIVYKDLIQGLELENYKVKHDKEFWVKLGDLIGKKTTEYGRYHYIKTGDYEYGKWNKESEEKTWKNCGETSDVIYWLNSLNLPVSLFNVFVLDFQKSFNKNQNFSVTYNLSYVDCLIKQRKSYDGVETKQEFRVEMEFPNQDFYSYELWFEYDPVNGLRMRYEVHYSDYGYPDYNDEIINDTHYFG